MRWYAVNLEAASRLHCTIHRTVIDLHDSQNENSLSQNTSSHDAAWAATWTYACSTWDKMRRMPNCGCDSNVENPDDSHGESFFSKKLLNAIASSLHTALSQNVTYVTYAQQDVCLFLSLSTFLFPSRQHHRKRRREENPTYCNRAAAQQFYCAAAVFARPVWSLKKVVEPHT